MVGRRHVGDVGSTQPRHVAGGAVVLAVPLAARRLRQAAAPIVGVARQAALAIIAGPLLGARPTMRVVARDAAQRAELAR